MDAYRKHEVPFHRPPLRTADAEGSLLLAPDPVSFVGLRGRDGST